MYIEIILYLLDKNHKPFLSFPHHSIQYNFYVLSDEFDVLAESKYCPQAIKHKEKPYFAVLFHPEVRNKKIIENFCLQ